MPVLNTVPSLEAQRVTRFLLVVFLAAFAGLFFGNTAYAQATDVEAPEPIYITSASNLHLSRPYRLTFSDKLPILAKDTRVLLNGIHLKGVKLRQLHQHDNRYEVVLNREVMLESNVWNSIRFRSIVEGLPEKICGVDLEDTSIKADNKAPLWTRHVGLSFSDSKGNPLNISPCTANLRFVKDKTALAWIAGFLAAIYAFFMLGKNSDLLKDTTMPLGSRRFSLARVQMSLWFFVIAASYVGAWVMTGASPELNSDILIVMGISSITYFAATALRREDVRDLQEQVETKAEGTNDKLVASYTERLNTAKPTKFPTFTRFFYELVADDQGVKLHRFQMVCWTVIFIVIYLAGVLQTLRLPELGGTALGLMGISSGTYLGFKFPNTGDVD